MNLIVYAVKPQIWDTVHLFLLQFTETRPRRRRPEISSCGRLHDGISKICPLPPHRLPI